jgi:thiamine-phosphate pyrophosphorylase
VTPRLHLVTDDSVLATNSFVNVAEAVLACCGRQAAVHARGHATSGERLHAIGDLLAGTCLRTGSWLLVNDRIDVAMAVRANGVQLGARSLPVPRARLLLGPGARIGYSAHGALEAAQAVVDGADFVLMGTIYGSASHPGSVPAGIEALRDCAARAGAPVLAIGGISPDRVGRVAAAGAHGVAVLGGVWHAADPVAAAAEYVAAVRAAWPDEEETG